LLQAKRQSRLHAKKELLAKEERNKDPRDPLATRVNNNEHHPLRPTDNPAPALEKEKKRKAESLARPRDRWDSNSYNGSSCYMSRSGDDGPNERSVNLLHCDDNNKENKKGEHSKVARIPTNIEVPTQLFDSGAFETQLSDGDGDGGGGDDDTMKQVKQELKESEAKRARMMVMMNATAGYPGTEEVVTQEINPPQPEMGTVCVWCGEDPCEWSEVTDEVTAYHRLLVDTIDEDELPPHNILRKRMYRKVAMIQGFMARQEHEQCVHIGIHELSPSPDGYYMCHKYV
jgi:hypothetical protein